MTHATMVPGLTVAIAASACAVDLFSLRIDTLAERMERSGQGSKVGRSSTTGGCCLEPPAWDLRASRTLRYGTHCSLCFNKHGLPYSQYVQLGLRQLGRPG
ncbi:hypothetical protein FPOAC2_02111 [Fusarium poae]